MKSLKRGSRLITLMISVFIIGMIVLIAKIQMEASFYISNSGSRNLGYICLLYTSPSPRDTR